MSAEDQTLLLFSYAFDLQIPLATIRMAMSLDSSQDFDLFAFVVLIFANCCKIYDKNPCLNCLILYDSYAIAQFQQVVLEPQVRLLLIL